MLKDPAEGYNPVPTDWVRLAALIVSNYGSFVLSEKLMLILKN